MTSLGDTIFGGVSGTPSRLPGNITTTKKFLVEVGDGVISSDPTWGVISGADLTGINADVLSSGSATSGDVASADGSGNVVWITPSTGALSVLGTRTSPILISATTGITSTTNHRQLIRVEGNGGAVTITSSPSISAGTYDGQELILEGCDITNTLTISGGSGVEQATTMILGVGDKIAYLWNAVASVWTEQWRISLGIGSDILTDDAGNPLTDNSGNPLTS
jgi:hypothetical protein